METRFCYNCYEEREVEVVEREDKLEVRGEEIPVKGPVALCKSCGTNVRDPELEDQLMLQAYREYRKRHNLLQPEEIAAIREEYGLSQRALARLLGWGPITVQRYERGALQNLSHNREILALRDPSYVEKLLGDPACKLSSSEKDMLRNTLTKKENPDKQEVEVIEKAIRAEPSEFTGFRQPDLEKLAEMAVYFARNLRTPLFKVKLVKLLFYADFLHYAEQGVSISGFPYARLDMGPVPERFQSVLAWMELVGVGRIEEVPMEPHNGEVLRALDHPDNDVLSPSEIRVLKRVVEEIGDLSGGQLANLSHEEPAWGETSPWKQISYDWARTLKGLHPHTHTTVSRDHG